MTDEDFQTAVERLANRVSHWTPPRWAASSPSGAGSRADVMYALVQRIADLAAVAEGEPRRPVPRLHNDLVLPDQLRVLARDLAATGAPVELREAVALVAATSASL